MGTNHKALKAKPRPRSRILVFVISVSAISLLCLLLYSSSTLSIQQVVNFNHNSGEHEKYLYWGNRIDCPGKHCHSCEGLGHQESSLRCALEEVVLLRRFMECKDRNNRNAIMLPYSFLPSMVAKKLRHAA